MNKYILLLTVIVLRTNMFAQTPVPAQIQLQPVLLKGGTAHIGNGQVIENAYIAFDKGIITHIGTLPATINEGGYRIIDASGQHIYPGFILPDTYLGLHEVASIDAMNDTREWGELNPNVRSLIAFNTDSKVLPTVRYNGILIVESAPQGGAISGTSSVMNLDGWNWEDAALKPDIGIHLHWPAKNSSQFDFASYSVKYEHNKDYSMLTNKLKQFFSDAIGYPKVKGDFRNLKLEAMQGLFSGEKILFVHATGAECIIEAITTFKGMNIKKIVLISGSETLEVAPFLAENNIPVIVPEVHGLPERSDMDVYLPFKIPALLTKAGVTVALSHRGDLASTRNLPFFAGTCAAWGLTSEQAIQLVTLNAAKILGVDHLVGTLEKGKQATLFISQGDALDMLTNNLSYAFINGRQLNLENEQQALYLRYSEKYRK